MDHTYVILYIYDNGANTWTHLHESMHTHIPTYTPHTCTPQHIHLPTYIHLPAHIGRRGGALTIRTCCNHPCCTSSSYNHPCCCCIHTPHTTTCSSPHTPHTHISHNHHQGGWQWTCTIHCCCCCCSQDRYACYHAAPLHIIQHHYSLYSTITHYTAPLRRQRHSAEIYISLPLPHDHHYLMTITTTTTIINSTRTQMVTSRCANGVIQRAPSTGRHWKRITTYSHTTSSAHARTTVTTHPHPPTTSTHPHPPYAYSSTVPCSNGHPRPTCCHQHTH